jgi:hypothetical protein
MKKGKSCVIRGYKQIKCSYGTVDSKNLKSIYLNIQSWVEPKTHEESWNRIVSIFNKYINLEVTFFLKKDVDFKSNELKNSIKNITNYIEKESFKKSNYFKFYLTKSNKPKTVDKIESI